MRTSLRWLIVVLFLAAVSLPTSLFADGNPSGPPPHGGIVVFPGRPGK